MKTITMIFVFVLLIVLLILPILSYAVDDGLVAYWTFNDKDGDTASDATGNGHDGTLIGDPQWVDGYFGGGLEFDADDEVSIPFHADLNQETFTISAWANVASDGAEHRAVVSSRDVGPQSGYIFYATPNNNKWEFWTGGGAWNKVTGPDVRLGEWDHIAGIYTNRTQKFYVNGELVGERDSTLTLNQTHELLIGAGANERAHEYFFEGVIDEVRIYDRELNANEIVSVMKSEAAAAAVQAANKLTVTWGYLKTKQ